MEEIASVVVGLLAVAGGAALLVRLFRSVARAALSTAEAAAANTVARASARRGDLTRMREGQRAERWARSVRGRAAVAALAYLLWLSVPLALGLLPAAYAVAAPLWFVPAKRARPGSRPRSRSGRS